MTNYTAYAKALIGALVAGLTALGTALADGELTAAEGVGCIVAALVALGAVYAVPNSGTVRVIDGSDDPRFQFDGDLESWHDSDEQP